MILIFGDPGIDKIILQYYKNPILVVDVDINKIMISNCISSGKKRLLMCYWLQS